MNQILFNPRWKEELEAISDDGILIFELTMGKLHVYFPDRERWNSCVPAWAKDKWELYLSACSNWCRNNNIPITLESNAHVYEEKPRR